MQTLAALKETEFIVEPVYLTEGGFYMRGLDDIAAFTPFERDKHLRVILADGVFLSVRRGKLRREFRPDVALICCHGGEGENGVLQGLLEFNGVPYTSAGVTASAVCMDKAASKCVFEQMLLNVPALRHGALIRARSPTLTPSPSCAKGRWTIPSSSSLRRRGAA